METIRVRFYREGGHTGLLNACDFNPARHINLDAEEAPERAPEAARPEDIPLGDDICALSVPEALALISEIDTREGLYLVLSQEKKNQSYEGGRRGVIKAIEARRAALEG